MTWTQDDCTAAGIQGWFVAGGIERVDDMREFCPAGDGQPMFTSDAEALEHVRELIECGDPLAIKARDFLKAHNVFL